MEMGAAKDLWHKWRALRLPWRRSFLVGTDLSGNTYWEFKNSLNSTRYRRMVKTARNVHLADVEVTPQWHQWLRHVRVDPPSIEELKQDLVRQEQLKQLARVADERWATAGSYLNSPQIHQATPAMHTTDPTINQQEQGIPDESGPEASNEGKSVPEESADLTDAEREKLYKENPWARAKVSKNWQPESWSPSAAER